MEDVTSSVLAVETSKAGANIAFQFPTVWYHQVRKKLVKEYECQWGYFAYVINGTYIHIYGVCADLLLRDNDDTCSSIHHPLP